MLDGTWRATLADDELRRSYPEPDLDDRDWQPIAVPGHWRSSPPFASTDGPILHRTHFDDPGVFGPGAHDAAAPSRRRSWLVFDGIFYTSDVWLDGAYLGDTEGYFFPHAFEITDALAARPEHTLAMEVSCRPEPDRTAKRNLTGVFQHWDQGDQDANPGGIWRSVRIEQSGPVRIRHLRAVCRDASAAMATIAVRCVLDTVDAGSVVLVTTVDGVDHRRTQPLASGENRVEWTVPVPSPRLWWPHALGDPEQYELQVAIETGDGCTSDSRDLTIGLRSIEVHDWVTFVNGERLFLKGSIQGPSTMALAEATDGDLARDIALAKDANLDVLRVYAHVSKPALYDAADAAGMLLWQDMPLHRGYHRSVRGQARRQARELVDLLGHHASIFTWCGHDEPTAIDVEPGATAGPRHRAGVAVRALAAQVLPTWNKSVLDHSVRKVLERSDGSRPVITHSGVLPHPPRFDGTDTHTSFGWRHGDHRDLAPVLRAWPRLARFVTGFGAQSVPEDASFLEPERWPDLDWDSARHHHGLQQAFMDVHVPPADFATFDDWRVATQRYQAMLIRDHVDTLRRLKYRPCGGFAASSLADGRPSVSHSVLGHDRRPKAGYEALASACAPVSVICDPLPVSARPGDRIEADIHVVSDRRIALEDMIVSVHLYLGEEKVGHGRSWTGSIPPDSCVRIGRLDLLVPASTGDLVVELVLAPRRPAEPATGAATDRGSFPVRRRTSVHVC